MKASELSELLSREEPLCDELRPHVVNRPKLGEIIHSPLIIEMFFDPKRCALINARYRAKLEELQRVRVAKNWAHLAARASVSSRSARTRDGYGRD